VFVWHFTPTHSSSEIFATSTGSALHVLLRTLQPGHGWLTRFQVYHQRQNALFTLGFPRAPAISALTRPLMVTRRVILQKARRHPNKEASTAWKQTISGSISLPSPGCFSPFPHGTVRYRSTSVCSLGRWSPQLPTGFFVPGGTQEHRAETKRKTQPGYHGLRRRVPNAFGSAQWVSVTTSRSSSYVLQPRSSNGCCLDTGSV
jgi:hypothetical protein